MRQSNLFTAGPSGKKSRDLLASDRKLCRPVTGLLTGQYTLRWNIYVMIYTGNVDRGRNPSTTYFFNTQLLLDIK
jgi:hypothetical protein